MFDDENENEEFQKKNGARPSRREHRSRRIDVMREWNSGVVDERPTKERFSREFKKPKIKRIKNPIENIGEENCEEGLVLEVHRRTCEVRLDKAPESTSNEPASVLSSNTVTAMYRATTTKELGEFPTVGDRVLLGQVNDGEDDGSGVQNFIKDSIPYAQDATRKTHYKKLLRYIRVMDYVFNETKFDLINNIMYLGENTLNLIIPYYTTKIIICQGVF